MRDVGKPGKRGPCVDTVGRGVSPKRTGCDSRGGSLQETQCWWGGTNDKRHVVSGVETGWGYGT